MKQQKYGNEHYWFCLEDGYSIREVAIWKGPEDHETLIARAMNKYEASVIVDALINYKKIEEVGLSTKELAFLDFVSVHCVEPYATMAANAILWKDHKAYQELILKFPQIYS